jgi:hypothetical protein
MRADTVQLGAELFRFCQKCGAAATGSVGPPSKGYGLSCG